MLDVVLLHLSPTGQTSNAYWQAGVAGNTFGLVWSFPGAPENGEIRLADKGLDIETKSAAFEVNTSSILLNDLSPPTSLPIGWRQLSPFHLGLVTLG